jgi:hypothetical protein
VPRSIVELIDHNLQKHPARRLASAAAFLDALTEAAPAGR